MPDRCFGWSDASGCDISGPVPFQASLIQMPDAKRGVPAGSKEKSQGENDGLRPQDNGRYDYRRHRIPSARRRCRNQGRQNCRRGRGARQGDDDDRGARPRGRSRLRRHPHPLRRADSVGPHDDDLAVARRDHGSDGQLRLWRRADSSRASRTHHAHARERRRDEPEGARDRARLRMAVRDLRAVPRCSRKTGLGDQCRRADPIRPLLEPAIGNRPQELAGGGQTLHPLDVHRFDR